MNNPNLGAENVDIKRGEGIVNELQGFRGKKISTPESNCSYDVFKTFL